MNKNRASIFTALSFGVLLYPISLMPAPSTRAKMWNLGDSFKGIGARALAFGPDGGAFMAGRNRAWISKWNPNTSREVYRVQLGTDSLDSVNALAVNPAGEAYAGGSIFGNGAERGFLAVLDANGKKTRFTNMPSAITKLALGSGGEVFLAGENSVQLLDGWSLGAPGSVHALATGTAGSLYVAGSRKADTGSGLDAYVAKLNDAHDGWEWVMTFGGTGPMDQVNALAIGADGSIFAAGETDSVDFPVTARTGGRLNGIRDGFLVKVQSDGKGLEWGAYVGGTGADSAAALAIDGYGNLLMAGSTDSTDFPGADRWGGAHDGFFARFESSGHLIESAYVGTAGADRVSALALDLNGSAFLAGSSDQSGDEVMLASFPRPLARYAGVTPSSVALAILPTPSSFGQQVTLTATVTPAAATGQVSFYDGVTMLGAGTISASKATLKTTLLPAGARSLRAFYAGDATYNVSTSPSVTQTVSAVPSTTFFGASGSPFDAGSSPFSVTIGDFNGDGKQDLAFANSVTAGLVTVMLGNGSGGFSPAAGSPFAAGTAPRSIAVGDFNGDGFQDLVIPNINSGNATILLGNGSGGFTQATGSPIAAGSTPNSVAVADVNGDGKADLIFSNGIVSGTVTVMLGNGSGGFAAASGSPFPAGNSPEKVVTGDFNGDGSTDLAVANYGGNNLTILLGNGIGGFVAAAGSPVATGTNPRTIAVGDFNGDGIADLAVVNAGSGNLTILLGNGTGGFAQAPGSPILAGNLPYAVAIGDFNSDGKTDLAVANVNSRDISILLGDGTGRFTSMAGSPYAASFTLPVSIAVGDFNGDGRADIVTADYNGFLVSASVLLGSIAATPAAIAPNSGSGQAASINASFSAPLNAKVTDSNGSPVAGVTVTFSAPLTGASASFVTSATTVTDASGIASRNVVANGTSGTYQVNASVNGVAAPASFTLTNGVYAISGQVVVSGIGKSGVTVRLSGVLSNSTITDSSGNYIFSGLGSGAYVVNPTLSQFGFTPLNTAISNLTSNVAVNFTGVAKPGAGLPEKVGTTYSGYSVEDVNGNFAWDGPSIDKLISWSTFQSGEKPIYGDWNGDGKMKVGVYNNGTWLLDYNGNGVWDGPTVDKAIFWSTGQSTDVPVLGDWNGDGRTKIGLYNNGTWILDYNGNGVWEGPGVDKTIYWSTGQAGEIPVVGDWNGDGKSKIGIHVNGTWILEYNGNYAWDGPGIDKLIFFGGAGYRPVVGDWNGSGWTKIGAYHVNGTWALDYNGNFVWDGTSIDKLTFFGGPEWTPVVGDWSGNGLSKIGAFTAGQWALDYDGNLGWNPPVDKLFSFGAAGQAPIVGKW